MPNGNSDKERLTALEVTGHTVTEDIQGIKTTVRWHTYLLITIILIQVFGVDAVTKIKPLLLAML